LLHIILMYSSRVGAEQKENDQITTSSDIKDLNPKKIKSFLDDYVVGQEYAKKIISSTSFNYNRLIRNKYIV